jgi:putative FmdB family regulatory protein
VPLYVYRCRQCAESLEQRQSIQDPPLAICPLCGGQLSRIPQPVGVIFKGSGFYSTDYRKASPATEGEPRTSSTNGSSSDKDTATTSTPKPEPAAAKSTTDTSKSD